MAQLVGVLVEKLRNLTKNHPVKGLKKQTVDFLLMT